MRFLIYAALFSFAHLLLASDYLEQIKPVFKERCYACHGSLKQKAGLRLDTAQFIRTGSRDQAVIIPAASGPHPLLDRISSDDPDERMPPEGKPLSAQTIEAIQAWIRAGAPFEDDEQAEDDPRAHWAFQAIRSASDDSNLHPVDAALIVQRDRMGTHLQALADRSILIRRLYLDLSGLPPSQEELQDVRPWERIVDDLLARPQYGERWGRHWMDIWRYSDWYGLGKQLRYSQKHLWHWRDWIVESLNEDKGYDRMITEMLAGDELAPNDPDTVRATGFLARNYYLFNRTTWLDSTIEHTGKAFLGLTFNCAKCHDHKYDAISQEEYYQFRAFFEPHQVRLDPVPGQIDFEKDGLPRVFDEHLDAATYLHVRGDEKTPDKERVIAPVVPAIFSGFAPAIQAIDLPYEAYVPGARTYVQEAHLKAARDRIAVKRKAVEEAEKKMSLALKKSDEPSVSSASDFELLDAFDQLDTNRWELIGDGWVYEDGMLLQKLVSRDKAKLRSREDHPHNFELRCRYTHTGGDTYKSISFRFDAREDGQRAHTVYTSAHAPGPKVQVAHVRNGKSSYPVSGRVNRPIQIGETYDLRFAVRDRVLNVWLDDEFLLAYGLPHREPGRIELAAFDASAAFDQLEVRALSSDVELQEPKDMLPVVNDAEQALLIAQAELEQATIEVVSLRAVIAADRARVEGMEDAGQLAYEAVCAQADLAVSRARTKHTRSATDKRAAAKKVLDQAITRRAELDDAADARDYKSIRGAFKALESPADKEAAYPAVYPAQSTGRRSALAAWITSSENPLTARVAVNHVWMRHFGEPLVENVFDFGRRSKQPLQLELLDTLAAKLIEDQWSLKKLHRCILTSEAYRLSSSNLDADPETLKADPENRTFWRMNPRRMESQVIRDSVLQLAGVLDLKQGGPSLDPKQGGTRRSLYFRQSRDDKSPFLEMFDNADILQCYRRSESIVPQQALAMANSKLALEQSVAIAARLDAKTDEALIRQAFKRMLARAPSPAEQTACSDYLEELKAIQKDPAIVRARFVHALLNHNDFVTIR